MTVRPGIKARCRFTRDWGRFKEGQEFAGPVDRVFRAHSGAVLVQMRHDTGDGFRLVMVPISKYVEWSHA